MPIVIKKKNPLFVLIDNYFNQRIIIKKIFPIWNN